MNNTNPIVSVIVPMYNVAQYITECIESVLAQTYPHFEIICVDDGCLDNTVELLNKFNDPRIKLIRQTNKGLAAARNTGINAALGMYIALLDSDDYWAPKKLELHVKHLQFNPEVGVSYSASLLVDENSRELGVGQFPKLKNVRPQDILCRNPVGNGSAAVIRRSALAEIGVLELIQHRFKVNYFDPDFQQSEDIECWIRMSLSTKWTFEGIREALTYYRVNTSGLSANVERQFDSWNKVIAKNINLNEEFFKKWKPLAEAYQDRYLARRALQAGDSLKALKLMHLALIKDARILTQEPIRTTITYACCLLGLLPTSIYKRIQSVGMIVLGRYKIS